MKIRTRLLLTLALFGLVILLTAAFLVLTFGQVNRLNHQEVIASDIEETARELSYLSNDYLLHGEDQQWVRWQTKFNELSVDLSQLSLDDPTQRQLAEQIKTNAGHLQAVFASVTDSIKSTSTAGEIPGANAADQLNFVRVSWSRLEVQNQNIIFYASQLTQKLLDQEDQLRQTSVILIYVLAGIFAAYLFTNYFLIYRRTLRALDKLQAGTKIIGSGQLLHQIDDRQKDEFGELSAAFNQMTTNLREITASKADLEWEIVERQQAEEALRASQARLRRLVEADIIGVFTRDQTGRVKDANQVFLNLVGSSLEVLQAGELNILDLVPAEERDHEAQWFKEAPSFGTGQPREKAYRRMDGRLVPVLVGETPISETPISESPTGASPDVEWIGFVLDLTELKRTQAALADYAEKLKRSNQELEQFAFIASHDLKEPLRKIRGFGDLLQRRLGSQLEDEPRDYLLRMEGAAERMQDMIDDLLELSRVGRRGQPFAPVALSDQMTEVLSDLEPRIQAAGAQVEISPLPVVEADAVQIRQLLQNLIANALKYHKPDLAPLVKVWCQSEPWEPGDTEMVQLCIEDNGIGFEEEHLEQIFRPFTRLHSRGEYEGTGMGLAICKKIVERHHGTITARSAPGEGSTFIVSLPLKQTG